MRAQVFGHVVVDETFAVTELPRPGASVIARAASRDLGGKGANQAIVLHRAGIDARLLAAVGEDETGRWIRTELAKEGLAAELVRSAAPTDRSIVLVGPEGENALVTTVETVKALTADIALAALAQAEAADALILQGNLSLEATRAALAEARRRGCLTVLNPSPVDLAFSELWPLVDLAIVNEGEAAAFTGHAEPARAAAVLRGAGAREVVVTLGARGALLAAPGRNQETVPAAPVEVVDPTGAGDTFAGILVACMLRQGKLDSAAVRAASEAAAITVSRRGTRDALPSRAEIAAILARHLS